MKKKDKEMLLKDLSARLPYGVKVYDTKGDITTNSYTLAHINGIIGKAYITSVMSCRTAPITDLKPYLFPLSSMTDEQEKEFSDLYYRYHESAFIFNERYSYDRYSIKDIGFYPYYLQDWLNANHFDYRGLIENGLAIDATQLDVY